MIFQPEYALRGARPDRPRDAFQGGKHALQELGVKLGWHPWEHVRLTLGYNYLYWSAVRRAQDQFNLTPALQNQTTAFWAQGFTWGMEVRF